MGLVILSCIFVFQLAAELEETQLEAEKQAKQLRKSQLTVKSLEDELSSMKTTKRLSTGFDTEDYKAEMAK